jgi:2-iminoacetate synthase
MQFSEIFASCRETGASAFNRTVTSQTVETVLDRDRITPEDLFVLLSDPASRFLEQSARRAADLTRSHFGNAVTLFTPMYIANHCTNTCPYCSFSAGQGIGRRQLTEYEISREAEAIAQQGIRHILVLTGDAPEITTFGYIRNSLATVARHFAAVGIEIYPLSETEYATLAYAQLADSLTLYQETYNPVRYAHLHARGPKRDFGFRLDTPDRACRARFRAVTIGALLGLDDFRMEAYLLACHVRYLQRTYPGVEVSVSFPRIRPVAHGFEPGFPVTDVALARILIAFRLIFPTIGITLSTRESPRLRDGIIPLGVTKISAGVSTAVGGHSDRESTGQFEIADTRSVADMQAALFAMGLQPVMHDWNMKMSAAPVR